MEGTQGSMNTQGQATTDAAEKDRSVLNTVEQKSGNVPTPLKIMAIRPGTVSTFMAHRKQVFEGGPLTERERSLVGIGVAVAMRSPECVRSHVNFAKKAGVVEDEIAQAMLVASVMLGASPLRAAYSGLYE